MSQIPNWRRQQSLEGGQEPYMWYNKEGENVIAKVMDRGDSYEAFAKVVESGWVLYSREEISSKEKARQDIVEWMRNNPQPRTQDEWYLLDRQEQLDFEEQAQTTKTNSKSNIVKAYHHPILNEYIVLRDANRGFFLETYNERGEKTSTLESPPTGGGGAKARMERYIAENN